MKTDRELLEAAARAAVSAGMNLTEHHGIWYDSDYDEAWAPLTDDGDALRLAVKLGLDVFVRPAQWSECGRIGKASCREQHKGDPAAATRRAIVRAAAELAP